MINFLKLKIIFLFFTFYFLFSITSVFAANLFFESKTNEVKINEQFEISLFINTEEKSINAFEGRLIFNNDILDLKEIRDGNSIVNFWIERPKKQNNVIVFSGITPGGFNDKKGLIFSAVFQAKKTGISKFEIDNKRILLNDGIGSEIISTITPFEIKVLEETLPEVRQLPELKDYYPPESFLPKITRDPNIFDGKWFVVFATQDKISGINYYKIKESRQRILNIFKKWSFAESPYLLQDQELKSYLLVKAVDKVGNKRIATLSPKNPLPWYKNYENWILIILIGLVIIFITIIFLKKRK